MEAEKSGQPELHMEPVFKTTICLHNAEAIVFMSGNRVAERE